MALSEDAVQLLGCCSLNYYLCGVVLAVVGTSEQNANPAQPLLRNIPVSISEVTPKDSPPGVTPWSLETSVSEKERVWRFPTVTRVVRQPPPASAT